jgi:hypothetical protein
MAWFCPALEVTGSEVLVEGSVGNRVVSGGEDRGGGGAGCFVGASPCARAMEPGFETAAFFAGCGPGAPDKSGLRPGRAGPHAGRTALARAFAVLGVQSCRR